MNTNNGLVIWTNATLAAAPRARLEAGIAAGGHRLVVSAQASASVLAAGGDDPLLAEADVAFGQPDAAACRRLERLKWIALTSAGYTRYDNEETKEALVERRAAVQHRDRGRRRPGRWPARYLWLCAQRLQG